jgi:uncharacterized protein (TIGR03000 family)
MQRRWYSWLGRAALISAALIFATGDSQAKAPGGGGGHGGGGGGHGGGGGRGGSFSGGGGRSSASFSGRSAPAGVSRSSTFAPATANSTWNRNGTSNGNWNHNGNWNGNWHGDHHGDHNAFFFWGFPFYSSWFWGYPYPYFYGGFPRWYYWNDYAYDPGPAYMYTPDGNYTVTEQPPQPPADMPKLDDNAVLIAVRVPDSAVIWFDGDKTTQTGSLREFITPPLEAGQKYTYEIKAQWMENGKEVSRTRQMDIYAGDRLMVNFLAPAKSSAPRPAPLKPPTPVPPAPAPSAPVP